jgi:putative chitinase
MTIKIFEVARNYVELPHQIKALRLLQSELDKAGLTSDECEWVKTFRTPLKAPITPEGKSVAASESIRKGYTGLIDWNNPRCYISEFFTVAEVTQGDRRRIPLINSPAERNILVLARELDKVRKAWGPIGVTSWYRPEPINTQVGGVRDSKHTIGLAADIYPIVGNISDFQTWLDKRWGDALGYGAKKGFVHVDCRFSGGFNRIMNRVRWDY